MARPAAVTPSAPLDPAPDVNQMSVGQRLLYMRHELGLSQRDMATHLGFNHRFISTLENGQGGVGLDAAYRLEQVTGVHMEWWLAADISRKVAGYRASKRAEVLKERRS